MGQNRFHRWVGLSCLWAGVLVAATTLSAQTDIQVATPGGTTVAEKNVDSLRASYAVSLPPDVELTALARRRSPGSSSGTPTGYGAEFGDIFVGAGFQSRMRYVRHLAPRRRVDGWVGGGIGLGNARKNLGVELEFTSYSTLRSGFLNHRSFSFKVHRRLPWNTSIAYGWENAIRSEGLDGGSSMYGVASRAFKLRDRSSPFSRVTMSAGVGGGRFQTENAIEDWKHGMNAFGSVGVRILPPFSLITEWTGQDLTLGASIVPFPRIPLSISPAFADVTGTAGDGRRFIVGVGMDFSLLRK